MHSPCPSLDYIGLADSFGRSSNAACATMHVDALYPSSLHGRSIVDHQRRGVHRSIYRATSGRSDNVRPSDPSIDLHELGLKIG